MKSLLLFLSISLTAFSMTIEEKVGQIIMCPIHGENLTDEGKAFLQETKLGGIILYRWANKLNSKEKIKKLIEDLQKTSIKNTSLPLFIGIDEEGGRVDRLGINPPSAEKIAKTHSTKTAGCVGVKIGSILKGLGINLNFAPVVDINSNKDNIIIGDRSFGNNAAIVTDFAKAFARGLLLKNIMPCLKHFPGHGDVTADSHYELPVSYKTLEEIKEQELIPYKRLGSLSPFIMTAHILFPNIDKKFPATLSKIFLQDILRTHLRYEGIIITDSLRMGAVLKKSLSEVAIDAFNAGNDILLIGGTKLIEEDAPLNIIEVKDLHKNLVQAVKDGRISMERLNQSVERILKTKKDYIKNF